MELSKVLRNFFTIILFIGSSACFEIECDFGLLQLNGTTENPINVDFYTSTLKTEIDRQVEVTKVSGTHLNALGDSDVKVLYVRNSTFAVFPKGIQNIFPSLEGIYIELTDLGILRNSDLLPFANTLKYLFVKESKIVYLGENLLDGLVNLEFADFSKNPLRYFGTNSFKGPTALKVLDLQGTQCTSKFLYQNLLGGLIGLTDFLSGLLTSGDVCLQKSKFEEILDETYNNYIDVKNKADLSSKNLTICLLNLEVCSSTTTSNALPTTEGVTDESTISDSTSSSNSDSTSSTSFICECPSTPEVTTEESDSSSTISTSTDLPTVSPLPDDCLVEMQLLIIEKNKYLNYTEVCLAERTSLQNQVKELSKEIEDLSPADFNCIFRNNPEGYGCFAMKISIKSTSNVAQQKIKWVGKHASNYSDESVSVLSIQSQETQLLPIEIGKSFKNLKKFIVESSGLQKIKKNDFKTLDNLEYLSIIGNEISSIQAGSFDDLKKLILLNLRGNQISSFPTKSFEKLTALKHLDVGENKFSSFRYDMIPADNVIEHFYADNNEFYVNIDILFVWRLSKAEIVDFWGTGCNFKFNRTLNPSFKAFFNDILSC